MIGLFNGSIPLVADPAERDPGRRHVSLVFTKVMDEMQLGLVDEDEEVRRPADRAYWEKRGTKQTVAMADEVFGWLHELDPGLELKYNKFYIGLAKDGRPNNFVMFRPQKAGLRLEIRLDRSDEITGTTRGCRADGPTTTTDGAAIASASTRLTWRSTRTCSSRS